MYHRNWGVGKIKEIAKNFIVMSFKDKENHKMEIQMALHSLKPLDENHFLVYKCKDINYLKNLFEDETVEFMKILITSHDNQISLSSIKHEVVGTFLPESQWSRWWAKKRTQILKNENISVSSHKKDTIEYKQAIVHLSDVLMAKFQAQETYEEKANIAVEAVKAKKDGEDVLDFIVAYFKNKINSLDIYTQILIVLVLDMIKDYFKKEDFYYTESQRKSIIHDINSLAPNQVNEINNNLKNLEIKRLFSIFIHDSYKQWEKVFVIMLLELPIKSHKYLFNLLYTEEKWDYLNQLLFTLRKDFRKKSEIFLWSLKYILVHNLAIPNINWKENILCFFRIMRSMGKIETKGTKLKSISKEIILGNLQDIFFQLIQQNCSNSLRKISSLFKDVQFLNEIEKEKIQEKLIAINPILFQEKNITESSKDKMKELLKYLKENSKLVVSANGLDKMHHDLEILLNVEIPQNSKEIGIAQEKGDLRENAEYKAAMEKQSLLQTKVKKLESEITKVEVLKQEQIPHDIICIGSKVKLQDEKTNNVFLYTVMDNWDANIDHGIISYQSPLGKELLGHRQNDIIKFQVSKQEEQNLRVLSISKAINSNSCLV